MNELLKQLLNLADYYKGKGEFRSGMASAYRDAANRLKIALEQCEDK